MRTAIRDGVLPATNINGRWYVKRDDLLAWHRRTRIVRRIGPPPWQAIADLLADYGSASIVELTALSGLHVGNVRKYTACLAKEGRAERRPDGQWVLTNRTDEGGRLTAC